MTQPISLFLQNRYPILGIYGLDSPSHSSREKNNLFELIDNPLFHTKHSGIHKSLYDIWLLRAARERPLFQLTFLPEQGALIPQRKTPQWQSQAPIPVAHDNDPRVIPKPKYLTKHCVYIPSVVVGIYDLPESEQQDVTLMNDINEKKKWCQTRNIKITIVLLIQHYYLDKMTIDERLSIIKKQCGVEKHFVVLPTHGVDLMEFVSNLETNMLENSNSYYKEEIKRLKKKQMRCSKPSFGWIKYEFKIAVMNEFRQDGDACLKCYLNTVGLLKELMAFGNDQVAAWMDVVVVKTAAVMRQLMPSEAWNLVAQHCKSSGKPRSQSKIVGFYAESLINFPLKNEQVQPGFLLLSSARYIHKLSIDEPLTEENSLESWQSTFFDYKRKPELTIDLFTRAYEQFKKSGFASRTSVYCGGLIANEHEMAGHYEIAFKFYERIAKSYRNDKCLALLADVVRRALKCAPSNEKKVELGIELCGLEHKISDIYSWTNIEDLELDAGGIVSPINCSLVFQSLECLMFHPIKFQVNLFCNGEIKLDQVVVFFSDDSTVVFKGVSFKGSTVLKGSITSRTTGVLCATRSIISIGRVNLTFVFPLSEERQLVSWQNDDGTIRRYLGFQVTSVNVKSRTNALQVTMNHQMTAALSEVVLVEMQFTNPQQEQLQCNISLSHSVDAVVNYVIENDCFLIPPNDSVKINVTIQCLHAAPIQVPFTLAIAYVHDDFNEMKNETLLISFIHPFEYNLCQLLPHYCYPGIAARDYVSPYVGSLMRDKTEMLWDIQLKIKNLLEDVYVHSIRMDQVESTINQEFSSKEFLTVVLCSKLATDNHMNITWSRGKTSTIQTAILPFTVTNWPDLDCVGHIDNQKPLLVGNDFTLTFCLRNLSTKPSELELVLDPLKFGDAFVFSGTRQERVRVLPLSEFSYSFTIVPLLSGLHNLPWPVISRCDDKSFVSIDRPMMSVMYRICFSDLFVLVTPVHQFSNMSCPMEKGECPMSSSRINPLTNLPYAEDLEKQNPIPNNLSKDRITSSIPRTDTSSNWTYPSESMFYNALNRKGHSTDPEDVEVMLQVHNFLNEGVWNEILQWEKMHECECKNVDLKRFQGRPNELTPRAKFYSAIGVDKPFDRHDWIVNRCGKEVRYVIDYYSGPLENGFPSFHVDVRPAIDSVGSVVDRTRMWVMKKYDQYLKWGNNK